MKKLSALLALALILGLWGCSTKPVETHPSTDPTTVPVTVFPTETTVPVETTVPATTLPEETTEPETTVPETTLPEHSVLYIPDLSVEDVILYFNEVCLDAEITHSGNPKVVQKWATPIRYRLFGPYTEKDLTVLEGFVEWLNEMEGFPGMYLVETEGPWDLGIHFCTAPEMQNIMGEQFIGMDGAVTFWYRDDIIYDATICYLTTIDQYIRNSVILEEIYNGLGPIQDTWLREDSIIYAGYSEPQALTEIDELILKLLYHPDMLPGMTPEEAEAVIRDLYY